MRILKRVSTNDLQHCLVEISQGLTRISHRPIVDFADAGQENLVGKAVFSVA
jgi:hypothetical protein